MFLHAKGCKIRTLLVQWKLFCIFSFIYTVIVYEEKFHLVMVISRSSSTIDLCWGMMRFQNEIYLLILYYGCVVKSYCTTDKDWFVEEQKIEKKFGYEHDKYKIEYLKIFENLWKSYQNVGSFNFCYVERDVRFIDTQDIAYVLENTIFCASEIDTITYTYSQTQKRVHVYSLMIASACIENHCWYQRNERKFCIGYLYKNWTIYRMLCWPLVQTFIQTQIEEW